MKKLIKPIIVFIIAYYAYKYLLWFGIVYAVVIGITNTQEDDEPKFHKYLWEVSRSIDQTLNAILLFPLNDFMRKPKGTNYGNPDETISGVTGKNQLSNSLTWFGKAVNWMLNKLEKDHCINAIEKDEK